MRLIDGNKIVMSLADWWYSPFGYVETEESKAIKKVMEQVEKMVMEMPEIVRCKDCDHSYESSLTEDVEACKEQKSKLESEKVQLSQETSTNRVDTSTNTSTDLISRQAAIEEIKNATTITGWNKYASQEEIVDDVERQLRRLFVGAIESLPPVEPKLVSGDTISKEALIQSFLADCECKDRSEAKAVTCSLDTMLELIEYAPPVESPKRVVAQIKVDTDELIERIKKEYEIKEKPVCEDAISRADAINAICANCDIRDCCRYCPEVDILLSLPPVEPPKKIEPKTDLVNRSDVFELAKSGVLISNDNYEKVCEAINGLPSCHTCRECEPVEQKPVEDTISKKWLEDNAKEFSGYYQGTVYAVPLSILESAPRVIPERPKGKWIFNPKDAIDLMFTKPKCSNCGFESADGRNFCPNCGADMRGDKE